MQTNEIREKYLDFFKQQGHTVCASDVLVPKWDNTVLFTPAGMNPFKDHFLGNVELEFTRATSSQKCLRTGDIENVGRTAYHHTFFEMLGNFSFGDYFKEEAIAWAWEFLTDKKWMGLDPARLTVTVYKDDDEAEQIWMKKIGLPKDRISRLGEHDNFWPAGAPTDGPDGVCGPCSEIFFHPDNGPECEIWNLVFTQFNRGGDPPNNLSPLPSKNIDTGMGLERMAAVMQGKSTNYHIDTLMPLVEACGEVCSVKYEAASDNGRRLRRIADHIRACTMAIHENVYPDKQKENYVIRRLLRRAVLQGHEMGLREPFLYQIVPAVVEAMKQPYPDLVGTASNVASVVKTEEENFLRTLDAGLSRIDKTFSAMESSGSKTVDGAEAFNLYQEQGIPAELFESIASDRQYGFDWDGYKEAQEKHAIASGAGQVGVMGSFGPLGEIKKDVKTTEFLGYTCTKDSGSVCGLIYETTDGDDETTTKQVGVESLAADLGDQQLVVLDRTPFYAESGGQVGDSGTIVGPNGKFDVTDSKKSGDLFVHYGRVTEGSLNKGDAVSVEVNTDRRDGIERAHSATHIMHYALQKFIGENAQQRGSKVEDDQLRFDFANNEAVSAEAVQKIEQECVTRIQAGSPVKAEVIPMEEARSKGAMMLFGEKYPDPVRMVSIGDFSKELCGGTHVKNTADIGGFEIITEEASSTGIRRIVAVTGEKAKRNASQTISFIWEAGEILGVAESDVVEATGNLLTYVKTLKKQAGGGKDAGKLSKPNKAGTVLEYNNKRDALKQVARLLNVQTSTVLNRLRALNIEIETLNQQIENMVDTSNLTADSLMEQAIDIGGVQTIVMETPGAGPDLMRKLIDQLRKKHSGLAIFLASIQGTDKVALLAGLGKDVVGKGMSAGDWVKNVAPTVGGGGGGRPDFAQAGGKQPEKINVALDAARDYVKSATAV